jgi:ubiquinone/menaquinone biosynthesis C-methylase UbiE
MAQIYDKIMQKAESRCLHDWRSQLLKQVSGTVLEIGAGTGVNLDYYPDSANPIYLLEPDAAMQAKLQHKISTNNNARVKILSSNAESIPLPSASCDFVVSTLVLCSVNNPEAVLAEIHRVLKPDGKFIFIEHVAAQNNPERLKWQKRLEPLWKIIACNCHLTRNTEQDIIQAGFKLINIERGQSMRGVPGVVRPSIKGVAVMQR